MPLFELDDVWVTLEGRDILRGVSFTVEDRGITVLAGPSGSGKTTILRLLNRLEVPTSGQVRFRGEPLDRLDPLVLRRRVGMVFQMPTTFPGTVRENLLVADATASEAALVAALDAAGLPTDFLDRQADELSGGEAQRMCLARTLVTEPEVLLMDEPTSALDREARDRLERTATELAVGGRPMVWVTHDLAQADRLTDRVIVVVEGRVADAAARDRYLRRGGSPDGGDRDAAGDAPAVSGSGGDGAGTAPEPRREAKREEDHG